MLSRDSKLSGADIATKMLIRKYSDALKPQRQLTPTHGLLCLSRHFALKTHANIKKRPILGICLGMQLFADRGFEGEETEGLSLIPGEVKHLNDIGCNGKVPHIGWNDVKVKKHDDLFNGISSENDFYFVHSYAFIPLNEDNVLSTVFYEKEIVAAIMSQNIYGTQFHPEKSSFAGQKLLKNFLEL